ncbi:uncharacterized protein LOC123988177 isoform X1 [Osmia bicornis bicornis]|uniref:uncharacterized protein LOC123988177 isoform X1 n=1 Tax=Osmia bicornis bicornis TaxID=1437191 RepID=UPI001EAE9CE5|nr:uncharacterized protein LOC123988177 isoform X1 [Osmia bicornis bicornis]
MVLLIEHHQPPSFRYFSHWPHGAEVKRGIGSLAGSHPGETLNDIPPSLNFLFSSSSVMLEMSRSLHDGFSFFNDATGNYNYLEYIGAFQLIFITKKNLFIVYPIFRNYLIFYCRASRTTANNAGFRLRHCHRYSSGAYTCALIAELRSTIMQFSVGNRRNCFPPPKLNRKLGRRRTP